MKLNLYLPPIKLLSILHDVCKIRKYLNCEGRMLLQTYLHVNNLLGAYPYLVTGPYDIIKTQKKGNLVILESISYPSIRVHINHYYIETLQVPDAQIDYYIIGIPDNANKTTYRFLSINENLINTEEIDSKLIMRFESIFEAKEYLSMIYKVMQSDHGLICNKLGLIVLVYLIIVITSI